MTTLQIRTEQPDDAQPIHTLTAIAFAEMSTSDGSEPMIIQRLREDGDLALSLVAVSNDGSVRGHIAFSPVFVERSTDEWFGLGPVSVHPAYQRRGVGSRLIRGGIDVLRARGAVGIALVGNPALYGRFGFQSGALSYGDFDPSLVQHLVLRGGPPSGALTYCRAFEPV